MAKEDALISTKRRDLKIKMVDDPKRAAEFKASCLKQGEATFTYRNVVLFFFLQIRYVVNRFKHGFHTI